MDHGEWGDRGAVSRSKSALEAEQPQEQQITPLSPRDAAGIAAEPWRKLLNAGDQGQIISDMEQMLAEVVLIAAQAVAQSGEPGDIQLMEQAKAAIAQRMVGQTLDKLQIQPDLQAMQQIQQRLLGYVSIVGADVAKREAGDFSLADTEVKGSLSTMNRP